MIQVIVLLSQIASIGLVQMLTNMLLDKEKNPNFSTVVNIACIVVALYMITRFAVANLLPQMGMIFRNIL